LANILVDGKPYLETVKSNDEIYSIVEPYSGFLMEQRRSLSFYVYLNNKLALPFPDLDKIG